MNYLRNWKEYIPSGERLYSLLAVVIIIGSIMAIKLRIHILLSYRSFDPRQQSDTICGGKPPRPHGPNRSEATFSIRAGRQKEGTCAPGVCPDSTAGVAALLSGRKTAASSRQALRKTLRS